MSEVEVEEMIPIRKILLEAAKEVKDALASDVEVVEILQAVEDGIRKGIEQEQRGLYALNSQQEKMLATFEQAKAEAAPGTKLQLVAVPEGAKVLLGVPKSSESGLVGADGKPLTDGEPKLIVPA